MFYKPAAMCHIEGKRLYIIAVFMKILSISLVCLCLNGAWAQNAPAQENREFTLDLKPAAQAGAQTDYTDKSTPLKAATLFLQALKENANWTKAPYNELTATSPFVSDVKRKSILNRLDAVKDYVQGAAKQRPAFIDEKTIIEDGDLAVAYILIPDWNNPYIYAATALALVKRDGQWRVSLTPGSFENTFLPFDDALRIKAAQMTATAKKKIFSLSNSKSLEATKQAIEFIKQYRKDNVQGKSDDEALKLLAKVLKENDPAKIAAMLVPQYYQETTPTQRVRLTPIVRAMRLQDMKKEGQYAQPSYLSFMIYPGTILVPLSADKEDYTPAEKTEEELAQQNNGIVNEQAAKQTKAAQPQNTDKKLRSLAALTINPPRMSLPSTKKPYIIHRYTLERADDPTDGFPVFKLNVTNALPTWTLHDDLTTLKRVATDFHKTYPPLAFPTVDEALKAAAQATIHLDCLTLIRMLSPENFENTERFEQGLEQLKYALISVAGQFRSNFNGALPTEALVNASTFKSPDGQEISKFALSLQDHRKQGAHFRFNLYFIKKEAGWMLAGADSEKLKMIQDAKKEEQKQQDNAAEAAEMTDLAKYEAGLGKNPNLKDKPQPETPNTPKPKVIAPPMNNAPVQNLEPPEGKGESVIRRVKVLDKRLTPN